MSAQVSELAPAFALVTSLFATPLLARAALGLRWIDRRDGRERLRKPRARPVPLVGGAAVLLALTAFAQLSRADPARLPWLALAGAFVLGFVDDTRAGGLRAGPKLAGQCLVGLLLAAEPGWSPGSRVLLFGLAVLAQNALNTFDNADGATASLALLALWPVAAARMALLGFLPFNLPWKKGGAPVAYLGDSGSHLLGVLLAWSPAARPALLLPLLDLLRLVFVRRARGQPPWVGDRRHLAHRLQAAGLPPALVVLALVAIACPPVLGRGTVVLGVDGVLAGGLLTIALFGLALLWTPVPDVPK